MPRVLIYCRESGRGEESISIPNQKARGHAWADERGHTVVDIAQDPATSGGMPMRDRPGLKLWLEPPKLGEWDILVGAKLDRLSRNTLDYLQMQAWLSARGKSLASVTEANFDFSTPEGELYATNMLAFAQFERRRGAQRRAEAAQFIANQGRWDGGRVPFGYMPDGQRGNYRLTLNPETAPIARRMVADRIAGKSFEAIARGLNEQGVITPVRGEWSGSAVRRILMSPALLGYGARRQGFTPVVMRGPDGKPIRFSEDALISEEQYWKLQAAMRTANRHRGQPQARHTLWHVAYCANCSHMQCGDEKPCSEHDAPLYGHRRYKHISKGNFYDCRRCHMTIPLEVVEAQLEEIVLTRYGKRLLEEPVTIPGDDHSVEITRLQRRAERLREELDEDYDEDLARTIARVEQKITALKNAPHEPERTEWQPVAPETTVADYWASQDTQGRNKFLRDYGFVFYADREGVRGKDRWIDHGKTIFRLKEPLQRTESA